MSEQINSGDGWRLIGRIEYVRIPAKPEPIKIRHTLIKCNSFNDVMRATNQDVSLLVGNADEARQLADWLTRYADWREAQEDIK